MSWSCVCPCDTFLCHLFLNHYSALFSLWIGFKRFELSLDHLPVNLVLFAGLCPEPFWCLPQAKEALFLNSTLFIRRRLLICHSPGLFSLSMTVVSAVHDWNSSCWFLTSNRRVQVKCISSSVHQYIHLCIAWNETKTNTTLEKLLLWSFKDCWHWFFFQSFYFTLSILGPTSILWDHVVTLPLAMFSVHLRSGCQVR